jgi:hypothetical protein
VTRWGARWQAQYGTVGSALSQLVQRLQDQAHDRRHPYEPTKKRPIRVGTCEKCVSEAYEYNHIKDVVARMPPPTPEVIMRLRALLPPLSDEQMQELIAKQRGPKIKELLGEKDSRRTTR